MKKRITAVCVLAAVAAFLFAACGKSEDGKITTTTQQNTTVKSTTGTTKPDTTSGGLLNEASEKLSEGMTELKSDISRMMD